MPPWGAYAGHPKGVGILHNTTGTRQPVAVYTFSLDLWSVGKWFHHPGSKYEGVIPYKVIGHSRSVVFYCIMQGAVTPCSSSAWRTTLCTNIHIQELVVSTCHCHQYNAVEALVVIVVRISIGWLLHGDVLAVHSSQTVVVVPSGAELGSNFLPHLFSLGAAEHFVLVDLDDGSTHLRYKLADGTCFNPEAELQTWIGISSG